MPLVPTQGADPSRLTPCRVLDLAIQIAEEAEERYEELARQLRIHHTRPAASFFGEMAEEEASRAAALRGRRLRSFPDDAPTVPPVHDVMAPDYDDVRAFMTLRQAVSAALDAEQRVEAFLDGAIEETADGEARALLRELRDDESGLESRLKADLAALPPEGKDDREDGGDDPVAQ